MTAEPEIRDFRFAVPEVSLLRRVRFQVERGTSLSVVARACGLVMATMMLAAYRRYFVRWAASILSVAILGRLAFPLG